MPRICLHSTTNDNICFYENKSRRDSESDTNQTKEISSVFLRNTEENETSP